MLLISYHIFPHVIFKSFVLCFIPVNTKEVDIGNLSGPGGAVIIVRDNDYLIKARRRSGDPFGAT